MSPRPTTRRRRAVRAACALAALLATGAGCTGSGSSAEGDGAAAPGGGASLPDSTAAVVTPPVAPTPADTGAPPGDFAGTLAPTRRERQTSGVAVLTDVRTARHDGYERVVFELRGDEMPGYDVLYETGATQQCGSGAPVRVAGAARLLVRLRGTDAHEFEGERVIVTVPERDRTIDYPLLRQLTLICDFEAQVEWVLGLAEQRPYRVLELRAPTRLVVDIQGGGAP